MSVSVYTLRKACNDLYQDSLYLKIHVSIINTLLQCVHVYNTIIYSTYMYHVYTSTISFQKYALKYLIYECTYNPFFSDSSFSLSLSLSLTFNPYIHRSGNGKHEQKQNKHESFQIICRHSLNSKQYSPQKLTLIRKNNIKIKNNKTKKLIKYTIKLIDHTHL